MTRRCLSLLFFLLVAPLSARESGLSWASDGQNIMLSWSHHEGKQIRIYRSTQPFLQEDLEDLTFPIANLGLFEGTACMDSRLAPGATYCYAGATDEGWWYQANPASVPPKRLPEAWILIDKLQYCLEVHSHGEMVKSDPVSFGSGAQKRKLRQDRASTPEGRYQISGRQPKAKWHRAFDINYPTSGDKARLKLLPHGQDIGEIQILGGVIDENST